MKLTQEEKRIKIAEACGWKSPKHPDASALQWNWTSKGKWWLNPDGFQKLAHDLPDYFNDLNAMHYAEKTVFNGHPNLWSIYLDDKLPSIVNESSAIECATASQRAEAFGLTLNLWTTND